MSDSRISILVFIIIHEVAGNTPPDPCFWLKYVQDDAGHEAEQQHRTVFHVHTPLGPRHILHSSCSLKTPSGTTACYPNELANLTVRSKADTRTQTQKAVNVPVATLSRGR